MTKIVKGGVIRRQAEKPIYAVPVESITFAGIPQAQLPAVDDEAVLIVGKVPNDPYKKGDALSYEDGNHNNDTSFEVGSVVGPAKYNVTVT